MPGLHLRPPASDFSSDGPEGRIYCKEMPREILPRLQSNGFDTQKQLLNGMKDFCCKKHKTKRVTQILPNDPCPQLLNLLTFLKASASKGSAGMFGN